EFLVLIRRNQKPLRPQRLLVPRVSVRRMLRERLDSRPRDPACVVDHLVDEPEDERLTRSVESRFEDDAIRRARRHARSDAREDAGWINDPERRLMEA